MIIVLGRKTLGRQTLIRVWTVGRELSRPGPCKTSVFRPSVFRSTVLSVPASFVLPSVHPTKCKMKTLIQTSYPTIYISAIHLHCMKELFLCPRNTLKIMKIASVGKIVYRLKLKRIMLRYIILSFQFQI